MPSTTQLEFKEPRVLKGEPNERLDVLLFGSEGPNVEAAFACLVAYLDTRPDVGQHSFELKVFGEEEVAVVDGLEAIGAHLGQIVGKSRRLNWRLLEDDEQGSVNTGSAIFFQVMEPPRLQLVTTASSPSIDPAEIISHLQANLSPAA